ncbi:MAG: acetylornithine carbamoyltransferase [Saprospiraceae bacterium]|nr:acetylornithine carbamoyltransferase [Saprospiraceae bacterium]
MLHFRSVHDVPDLPALLARAQAFKANPRQCADLGLGKTLGLVFLNPSTRTRISSQIAARHLGMEVVVFNAATEGWAMEFEDGVVMDGTRVEHIREAAPVLGQYFDILGLRSFPALQTKEEDHRESILNQFVQLSGLPLLSLESATLHPLQSLADLLTIQELRPARRPRIALSWAPHIKPLPHCVANSFAQWVTAWGEADLVIAQPEGYALDEQFTRGAHVTYDQAEALEDADFVYVKNWSATDPYGALRCTDPSWLLTPDKLARTRQARVLHCLPVRRDLELPAAVLNGPQSAVVQQAGNRVWAAQAVLEMLLRG